MIWKEWRARGVQLSEFFISIHSIHILVIYYTHHGDEQIDEETNVGIISNFPDASVGTK